jgi:hypothetical protein
MPDEFRFDPVDPVQIQLLEQLSPGQRLRRMLDARAVVVGLIRGRLRKEYPELSRRELNLKVLEELEQRRN